jgi:hypothetical protein
MNNIEQNRLGFEGDTFAFEKFRNLVSEHKIDCIIETGTFLGSTTKKFTEMVPEVHTIEVNENNFNNAVNYLKEIKNVHTYRGNSPDVLLYLFGNEISANKNILFFLDAHWNQYNPLLDELKVIAEHRLKPVIAIHDFKVPGHPELGFDTYKDIVYEFDWIKSSIENIYGPNGYNVEYNSDATGAKRGLIYITPKVFCDNGLECKNGCVKECKGDDC